MIKYFLKPIGYSALSLVMAFGVSILARLYNGGSDRFQFYSSMQLFGLVIAALTVRFILMRLLKKITALQHRNKQVNTHLFFALPFALVSYLALYDKADLVGYFAAAMSAANCFLAAIIFYISSRPKVQAAPYSPTYNYTIPTEPLGYTDYTHTTPGYTAPTYTPPPAPEKKMEWMYTDKGLVYGDKDKYEWADAYGTKKEKKWY